VEEQEIRQLRDIQGFIEWSIENDMEQGWCLSGIGHDVGILLNHDENASPRTNGYARHLKGADTKLYIAVIEFQGLIEHIQPFRDKKLAEAYFEEKTSVPWEAYTQMEKGPESILLLGNYFGSYIHEFDDFV
jgi:hypothetical protein